VRTSVVARLAVERADDVDAIVPTWAGRPQPLVALYRRTLADTLSALVAGGERRLHVVADGPRVLRVPAAALAALDPEGESFLAINTPEAFAHAAALWAARRAAAR
jgi:molybdopterin-guanine dinucleotide biosynthesis protein A